MVLFNEGDSVSKHSVSRGVVATDPGSIVRLLLQVCIRIGARARGTLSTGCVQTSCPTLGDRHIYHGIRRLCVLRVNFRCVLRVIR